MTIPLTVLGGFLGAGKTTALNRLLRDAPARVGVLVNDFGAIGVDAALIAGQGGGVVSLANGCVCCAIGPDLGDSLARVVAMVPERIVIEASGVADPWRIAQLARLEPSVALDAVLVLADATAFTTHLADSWLADTLERQVARADLVAISKTDAVPVEGRAATEAAVQRIRPGVRMAALEPGGLAGLLMLGTGPPRDKGQASRRVADAPGHGFRSWSWRDPPPLDEAALRRVMGTLPSSVLRAKGVCRVGPGAVPHLLQMAGARWTLERWTPEQEAAEHGLVLIGTPDLPPDDALATLFAGTVLAFLLHDQET